MSPIPRSSCDEETPLLEPLRRTPSRTHSLIHQAHSPRIIITLITAIVFIIGFGGYLVSVPSLRIYEDILCHRFYERRQNMAHFGLDTRIDERWCKVDEVQEELNILTAGLETLKSVPGMFMAVPYGLLADKIGRKPVFALAILGLLLSLLFEIAIMHAWRVLPIRLVWLAPFVQFLGGGGKTASAIFYAIISDVTTQSQRANAFLFGACATLTAELIAPTVASTLMAISPWIPLCCGLAVLALGLCLIAFLPETLHLRASTNATPDCVASIGGPSSDSDSISKLKPTLQRRLTESITNIYVSTTPFHALPILLLLLPFITGIVGTQSIDLCIRYISSRFQIPLSHASLILSLRALINILLLLFFIPILSTLLISKFHFTSQRKDLYLARTSSLFLITGALLLATSPSLPLTLVGLVIYTLGTGFVSLVRSLITSLVDAEHVARLYAIIAVVETSSALVAGPMVAGLYEMGLEWKGAWLGLPFWGLAGVLMVGAVGAWCVRFDGEERNVVLVTEEEELITDSEVGSRVIDSQQS